MWGRVATKITLISVFFVVALGAIIWFTAEAVNAQENDARIIQFVGRQRMLQKQHVIEVLLLMQGKTTRAALDETRALWRDTQDKLINGGEVQVRMGSTERTRIPAAADPVLLSRLEKQRDNIEEAIKKADALLKLAPESPEYAVVLQELQELDEVMQALGSENAHGFTQLLLDKINDLVDAEVTIGIIVSAAGFLFGWIISREISKPLQQVVRSAQAIAEGNLRIDKLNLDRADEVGMLGEAFDHMLDNLKGLSGQIAGVTENVNSATAEILASTQQQAASTREQAATVQEVTTTMQEITQSGTEITDRVKQVAASAEAASTASSSGIAAVQNTNRLMENVRQQVEEVALKIVSLSEKTQVIGEIINTVNDIAEQSNLLALNASIEAASAGEQGSRFSVVAGEMRNLAERAKESTVQVSSILSDIQKGINSSVMLAEEAVKRSESGKHQSEVAEKTIHQMMQTTVDSINAFQQIIGATSQQQIGFDQVAQGMRDIRMAAEQNAVGTGQLEQALSNLNVLSSQLRLAVSRYQV